MVQQDLGDPAEHLRRAQAVDVLRDVEPLETLEEHLLRDGEWEPPREREAAGFAHRDLLDELFEEQ